jgi:hypothetical protein
MGECAEQPRIAPPRGSKISKYSNDNSGTARFGGRFGGAFEIIAAKGFLFGGNTVPARFGGRYNRDKAHRISGASDTPSGKW